MKVNINRLVDTIKDYKLSMENSDIDWFEIV